MGFFIGLRGAAIGADKPVTRICASVTRMGMYMIQRNIRCATSRTSPDTHACVVVVAFGAGCGCRPQGEQQQREENKKLFHELKSFPYLGIFFI